MNMTVNEDALNWYKEELDLQNGDQVSFFCPLWRLQPRSKRFFSRSDERCSSRGRSHGRSRRHHLLY